jgi:hypothetical protein
MAVINILPNGQPPEGSAVFNPMIFEFAWDEASCTVENASGNLAIRVAASFNNILNAGDRVRITDGTPSTYVGSYTIVSKSDVIGGFVVLTLDGLFVGNVTASKFIPDTAQNFQLITGYLSGVGSADKAWAITSTIRVNPNGQGIYRFDVSGFLKSRFEISEPLLGPNVDISLRYLVRVASNAALPSDANALTAYYGLQNLSQPQQDAEEAIGERPILFFGNVPTLYSLAGEKGIVNNFIANPDQGEITTSSQAVNLNLLSCEPKEVLWLGLSSTSGFTVSPALPDWLSATSQGNNIKLIINPCTGGVADYLANDYNPTDYLTTGQLNSVTGCFTFVFSLGGDTLFTLNVCVTPVSELIDVCKADVLNFAWLNQIGGFSSFAIESKYLQGREFGAEQTIVTSTRVLKRIEYKDVYDTFQLSGGILSKNQLDLLQSLRSSIQAFLYNEQTQAWDIPIVINRGSFTTYGNRFNQSETRFAFSFRVSQQVRIQTQ